jgi:putative endonuclease
MSSAGKPWWRRWFGTRAERAAGELDLLALAGRCVVFVEVRSTGGKDATAAAASVDATKQQRLTRLALHFLSAHRLLDHAARFDVLTVHWPDGQAAPAIAHYPNAFEAVGSFQMYS